MAIGRLRIARVANRYAFDMRAAAEKVRELHAERPSALRRRALWTRGARAMIASVVFETSQVCR